MNRYNSYVEVVAERKRLEAELVQQKSYIRSHVMDIRDRMAPITRVLSFFSRTGHNGQGTGGNLLKMGSNLGIDLLVGTKLRKAGWLARLVLPLVMKFTANKTIDAVRK